MLNKFRGDEQLLAPGPEQLQRLTGVPTLAVLPMWRGHGLPEEDGVFDEATVDPQGASDAARRLVIAVVAYPHISNLDELQPLRACPAVSLRWARTAAELARADWIILPGSKSTSGDRAWMREQGLDPVIRAHAAAGRPLLGICGGLQILGGRLRDPHGVDGDEEGLGLLSLETRFDRDKRLAETRARFSTEVESTGVWSALAGVSFDGYEIRHGRTAPVEGAESAGAVRVVLRDGDGAALGWQRDNVLGLYVHGMFEAPAIMRALFGQQPRPLDAVFDGLADFIDARFEAGALARLVGR